MGTMCAAQQNPVARAAVFPDLDHTVATAFAAVAGRHAGYDRVSLFSYFLFADKLLADRGCPPHLFEGRRRCGRAPANRGRFPTLTILLAPLRAPLCPMGTRVACSATCNFVVLFAHGSSAGGDAVVA